MNIYDHLALEAWTQSEPTIGYVERGREGEGDQGKKGGGGL